MQVSYNMTKKDLKHLMEKKQKESSYYLLLIASTYYIIFNICLSLLTFWLFYLSYVIFMAVIWLLLDIINRYYIKYLLNLNDKIFNYFYGESTIIIDDGVLNQKNQHKEVKIKLEDIKKIIIHTNSIVVILSQNTVNTDLIFYQGFFQNKRDFGLIKSYFKKMLDDKK